MLVAGMDWRSVRASSSVAANPDTVGQVGGGKARGLVRSSSRLAPDNLTI
jgi:hypothetical protein